MMLDELDILPVYIFCLYFFIFFVLTDNIKAADSVQNFKKQLKTLLFRKEFN